MSPFGDRPPRLESAVVLRVEEQACSLRLGGSTVAAEYAAPFPTPHVERVSPGHRVALVRASADRVLVLWRWYDAVVIGAEDGLIRLWEPAHGEVLASPRAAARGLVPGARAYLSAGLPGADWWVAGPALVSGDAEVELDEVAALYTRHELWASVLAES